MQSAAVRFDEKWLGEPGETQLPDTPITSAHYAGVRRRPHPMAVFETGMGLIPGALFREQTTTKPVKWSGGAGSIAIPGVQIRDSVPRYAATLVHL